MVRLCLIKNFTSSGGFLNSYTLLYADLLYHQNNNTQLGRFLYMIIDYFLHFLVSVKTVLCLLDDTEDILRYCERVTSRCLTVEVTVHTNRDRIQEDALYQVNRLIDGLVISIKADPSATRTRCLSFMAACSSSSTHSLSDKNFETAILGCTLDDQKRIRKRLQGLLDYMNQEPIISTID